MLRKKDIVSARGSKNNGNGLFRSITGTLDDNSSLNHGLYWWYFGCTRSLQLTLCLIAKSAVYFTSCYTWTCSKNRLKRTLK